MQYLWIGIVMLGSLSMPSLALAECTTWTVMDRGKIVFCQQCCQNGHCNVICN